MEASRPANSLETLAIGRHVVATSVEDGAGILHQDPLGLHGQTAPPPGDLGLWLGWPLW
jgi:hypothetical protein